jgi:hypothetical protein
MIGECDDLFAEIGLCLRLTIRLSRKQLLFAGLR